MDQHDNAGELYACITEFRGLPVSSVPSQFVHLQSVLLQSNEYLQLPGSGDLRSDEQTDFEHLVVGDSNPPPDPARYKSSRTLSIGILSSISIHLFALLLLNLFFEWRIEPKEFERLPSFDISLSGFEPSNQSATESFQEDAQAQPTDDSILESNENFQQQTQQVLPALQEYLEQALNQESAAPALATIEDFYQQPEVDTESSATSDNTSQQLAGIAAVVTQAFAPSEVFVGSEQNTAHTQLQLETQNRNHAQRAAVEVSRALSSNQLESLETQIKFWQQDLLEQLEQSAETSWSSNGQTYTAQIKHLPAQSPNDIDHAEITISTVVDGEQLQTTMEMKRLAFSHYGQFVNHWGRDMYLHQDVIEGRFHSNTSIKIQSSRNSSPVFRGPVSTAYEVDVEGRNRASKMFLSGLETRVKHIPFLNDVAPITSSVTDFGTVPENQIQYIDGDATIIFYSDGSFTWQKKNSSIITRRRVEGGEFYILGSDDSIFNVKGIVKGRVVVYTPEEISIIGDIRYADDPELNRLSTDFLGLISEKYIEIASPTITGPGDLTVYAAIYAKRRFSIRRFTTYNDGLLTIYGSLSAGSLSASEPRYATSLRFDHRFESQRPPGFPMTNRFELENWDRQWHVAN